MTRERMMKTAVFCALVGLAIAVRLTTETPNFGAVSSAALFAGFYFRRTATAAAVPLLAMAVSDLVLGGYEKHVMVAVYGSLVLPILWRAWLQRRPSVNRIATATLASSLAFFVITNAAVWYTWYPHSLAGMTRCYAAALPFCAHTVESDLLFAASFFGVNALATKLAAVRVPSLAVGAAAPCSAVCSATRDLPLRLWPRCRLLLRARLIPKLPAANAFGLAERFAVFRGGFVGAGDRREAGHRGVLHFVHVVEHRHQRRHDRRIGHFAHRLSRANTNRLVGATAQLLERADRLLSCHVGQIGLLDRGD